MAGLFNGVTIIDKLLHTCVMYVSQDADQCTKASIVAASQFSMASLPMAALV